MTRRTKRQFLNVAFVLENRWLGLRFWIPIILNCHCTEFASDCELGNENQHIISPKHGIYRSEQDCMLHEENVVCYKFEFVLVKEDEVPTVPRT